MVFIVQHLEVLGSLEDKTQFPAAVNESLAICSVLVACIGEVGTRFSCDQIAEMEFLNF